MCKLENNFILKNGKIISFYHKRGLIGCTMSIRYEVTYILIFMYSKYKVEIQMCIHSYKPYF